MFRYLPFQVTLFTNDSGEYSTFGIKVLDSENNEVLSVSDVSPDKDFVCALCSDCNENLLEPVHLADVIEDYL